MSVSYEQIQQMLANPNANLFGGGGGFDPSALQSLGGTAQPTIGAGGPARSPFAYTPYGKGDGQASGLGYIGANAPLLSAGIGALSQGFGIYAGLKNLSLAKKSFGLQKEAYKTNLANQTQSYNTQVADRIAGRSYASEEERQAALRAAQLPTPGG